MTRTVAILASFLTITAVAQIKHGTLGNSHQLRINANGLLGINLTNLTPASYLEGSSSLAFLAQAGLWITATDQNDKKHSAVQYVSGVDSFDFYPGPINTITGQAGNLSTWNKVWQVTQEQIRVHQQNFTNTDYVVPANITDWPANGYDGFSTYLAPFIDYNSNAIYDPENGDYPAIKGEESIYVIFNDVAKEHDASLGVNLGMEVQLLAYKLINQEAIFLEYYIIQRKNISYKDVQFGFFISGECGNKFDNYAGTYQENPQAIFIYNGDSKDEGYFEENIPYTAAIFLENGMASSIAFDGSNEKNGKPRLSNHYTNYSDGLWQDGTALTKGGTGTSNGLKTPFIYPTSKDASWTEESAPNEVGERSILGVLAGRSFSKNDYFRLRVALVTGNTSNGNSKDAMLNQIISTKNAYLATATIPNESSFYPTISLYPNPASNQFIISNGASYDLTVLDITGKTVTVEKKLIKNDMWCNISASSGIYTVILKSSNHQIIKKVCIQH
jgi:hypothetical protein